MGGALAEPAGAAASPLKPDRLAGVDLLFVRELTGGIYFGQPKGLETTANGRRGFDTLVYDEHEIRRILDLAFRIAQGRRKHVTSIDKANVLDTMRLWREVAMEVSAKYPDDPGNAARRGSSCGRPHTALCPGTPPAAT